MNTELALLVFLGILLVMSNVFWFQKINELHNKLMSRSYPEFAQTQKYLDTKEEPEVKAELSPDPYDEQRAREISGAMGLG